MLVMIFSVQECQAGHFEEAGIAVHKIDFVLVIDQLMYLS